MSVIFKFKFKNNSLTLENGYLKNITSDQRTSIMPKEMFIKQEYNILKTNIFMSRSDLIMKMALKDDPTISCLYYKYKDKHIVILPSKNYSFLNNRSIDPVEFKLF